MSNTTAPFESEKDLHLYHATVITNLANKYEFQEIDLIALADMGKTLMGEYARLLAEGKITVEYKHNPAKAMDHINKTRGHEI